MNKIDELLKKVDTAEKMSPEEMERLKVEWYNETEGYLHKEDNIECDKCKNKGWIHFLDGMYVKARKCECMGKRMLYKRAKNSGLGEYLNKKSHDYKDEEEWQRTNKSTMISYCKNHAEDNTWFATIGSVGSGKTLMCSIIANHLLFNLGRNVLYVTWTDFISRLKRDMMSDNANEVNNYLDEVKKVEVLFLDELVKKYNETDLKYLIEIINYRYTNDLKTLITSEKELNELLDIDEATFSRVVEKCKGYFINTPKDRNKNYRLKNNSIL